MNSTAIHKVVHFTTLSIIEDLISVGSADLTWCTSLKPGCEKRGKLYALVNVCSEKLGLGVKEAT